jgi:hypothetical protein
VPDCAAAPPPSDLTRPAPLHAARPPARAPQYNGQGTERNLTAARLSFEAGNKAGNADATFNLATMHLNGVATDVNVTLAAELYKQVRPPPSADYPGPCCCPPARPPRGRPACAAASGRGTPGAPRRTAACPAPPPAPAPRPAPPQAVSQGHWRATHALALLYEEGKGVERDCVRATAYLRSFVQDRGRWQQHMQDALQAYDDGEQRGARPRPLPRLPRGALARALPRLPSPALPARWPPGACARAEPSRAEPSRTAAPPPPQATTGLRWCST